MQEIRERGFTLIELSIVLVIIGLIAGAILTGKDLIQSAYVRKTITQKDKYDSAVETFQLKYNCLAGDCINRVALGFAATGGGGNGSGTGTFPNGSWCQNDEYKWFWSDLFNAGFISDTFPGLTNFTQDGDNTYLSGWSSPTCPVCTPTPTYVPQGGLAGQTVTAGGWDIKNTATFLESLNCPGQTGSGGQYPSVSANWYWGLSAEGLWGTGGSGIGELTPQAAFMIDAKIDDGMPLTGSFVAINTYSYSNPSCSGNQVLWAPSIPGSAYVNATNNAYVISNNPGMDIAWRAGF